MPARTLATQSQNVQRGLTRLLRENDNPSRPLLLRARPRGHVLLPLRQQPERELPPRRG